MTLPSATPNVLAGFTNDDYNNLQLIWLADYEGASADGFPKAFWTRPMYMVSLNEIPEASPDVAERIVSHALDRFSNFRKLSLEVCISPKSLARLKCLQFIEAFRGGGLKAVYEYVAVLKTCPHLAAVTLNSCDLKHYQFENIDELPGLKSLDITTYQHEAVTASQLINICKAKNLETLNLSSWHYSKTVVGLLAKLKKLKKLGFNLDDSWGRTQIVELRQALPNCNINTGRLIRLKTDD